MLEKINDQASEQRSRFILLKTFRDARRRKRLLQQTVLSYLMSRRRLFLQVRALTSLLLSNRAVCEKAVPRIRSFRRLHRNRRWWKTVWNTYTEKRFKETFRVSKATFQFILSHIRHDLERNNVTEDPISPEKRLCVCLYHLARGDYHYTIAEMAGIGVATVSTVVDEVCESILKKTCGTSVLTVTSQRERYS